MGKIKIVIDSQRCKLSGNCVTVCPQKAINIREGITTVDYEKCDGDGICIPACPEGAIQFLESEE